MSFQLKAGGDLLAAILELLIRSFGRMLGHITIDESGDISIGMVLFFILLVSIICYGIYRILKRSRSND